MEIEEEGNKSYNLQEQGKNKKPIKSAATGTSCEDLLIEISKLLPVKQFVRLKLVCKHWKSIIFDQLFMLEYV